MGCYVPAPLNLQMTPVHLQSQILLLQLKKTIQRARYHCINRRWRHRSMCWWWSSPISRWCHWILRFLINLQLLTYRKRKVRQTDRLVPFKSVGMLNTHGSAYAFQPTWSFAMLAVTQKFIILVTYLIHYNPTTVEVGFSNRKELYSGFIVLMVSADWME